VRLEIATHCWNYSRLLTYHLSSLVLFPPKETQVKMTIVYAIDDDPTKEVIDYFKKWSVDNVEWATLPLAPKNVCRRTIGRNQVALDTQADWVWFCDADYWFGEGALDALGKVEKKGPLVYPRLVWVSKNHGVGDKAINEIEAPRIAQIDREDFVQTRYRRAIGGAQIARGDVLREKGYLNGNKGQMRPSAGWRRTSEDRLFRITLGTGGVPVEFPNVYRIRHSVRGGHGKETVKL